MTLDWLGETDAPPTRVAVDPRDVERCLGVSLPAPRPFWKPIGTDWYACQVGSRAVVLGRVNGAAWQAAVNQNHKQAAIRRFPQGEAARCWALDQLANLAAEFDPVPLERR